MDDPSIRIRPAGHDDYEDVASFTRDTWPDREESDYVPAVYHDWIEGDDRRTLVAEVDGDVAAIAQCVLLSGHEAWCQGMRVAPAARGEGIGLRLVRALFEWAREEGAVVARDLVHSWNGAGMGQSRAAGFRPVTSFRWIHPDPDPNRSIRTDARRTGTGADRPGAGPDASANAGPDVTVVRDPDAAWSWWLDSDARDHLRGLALSAEQSWALRELTREDLRRAADEGALFAARDETGIRGVAYRARTVHRDNGAELLAEYGVGAWADLEAARSVLEAVAADAADLGANDVRVLIPATVRHVSDVATHRVELSDAREYVFGADLAADLSPEG